MVKFKDRLNEIIYEKQMTQSLLAKKIFLTQSTVSRYCNGNIMPPIDILVSICKELDVSADYLLGLTD
ncbi:MAG: helix-turn-helix domain-containing protein [Clostridia bacterium]|nr:helix-turn-helix domain-containing protein [Clostridia bacterium]